ncbi:MAG: N-acetyltransferase family protein [bacterium]
MRRPLAEYRRGQGEGNRRALRELVARRPPGLIAYAGDEPVGWVAVGPREEYVRLSNSRVLAPVAGERVWSAPCFFVAAAHRGRGVTHALLAAATRWARAQGAAQLEGYPHPDSRQRQPAAFVFGGFESVFRDAGFEEIARRSPVRPILRRALRGPRRPAAVPRRASVRRG